MLQNSPKPLYTRPPRSGLYLGKSLDPSLNTEAETNTGLWYTGFTVGMLGITAGIYEMIKVRYPS